MKIFQDNIIGNKAAGYIHGKHHQETVYLAEHQIFTRQSIAYQAGHTYCQKSPSDGTDKRHYKGVCPNLLSQQIFIVIKGENTGPQIYTTLIKS